MIIYKHKQSGFLMWFVAFCISWFFWWIYTTLPPAETENIFVLITMGLVIFILLSFSTLETTLDETSVQIKFGYGIFSKKFLLNEITSVKTVKNRWYYGWGIRVWFAPYMWIYNVSGLDAVELVMKNGKIYRIGTDVPEELCTEIKKLL